MQSAFSGGHKSCQEVARTILEAGGNAFDATIATHLAMFIAEPCMASAGGNGFALLKAKGSEVKFLDFFAQTPRQKLEQNIDYHPIVVNFGTETEEFHIGLGSVAVPGSIAALYYILKHYASMPMSRLVEPAIEMAKEGVKINDFQAHDIGLLSSILGHSSHGKELFFKDNKNTIKQEGDFIKMPQMADFLYCLAKEGQDLFYKGDIAKQIEKDSIEKGGHLRRHDFENYSLQVSSSLIYEIGDRRIHLPNGPSKGGAALALFLEKWKNSGHIFSSMKDTLELLNDIDRLEGAMLSTFPNCNFEISNGSNSYQGTSHFNIIDTDGNAISFTSSIGEGSGYFIPGTDMQLNNMLGEVFLLPNGPHSWEPNTRMHSMMTPIMITESKTNKIEFIAGSGGASRIPFMLAQVIDKVVNQGISLEKAIESPRVFYQYETAQLELGARSMDEPFPSKMWNDKSLYFGGVHAISMLEDKLKAHGDSRRLGCAFVF